jgi:hypothetical protein
MRDRPFLSFLYSPGPLVLPPNPSKAGFYGRTYNIEKPEIKIFWFRNDQVFNDTNMVINKIFEVLSSLAPL